MVKVRVNEVKQAEAVAFISATREEYKKLLKTRFDALLEIYKEKTSFTQPKLADWSTTFKVNKMFEISNKTLPRIVSKNPKWIVDDKIEVIERMRDMTPEERGEKLEQMGKVTRAIGDYLDTLFDKHNLLDPSRIWAKNMIDYGYSFAKVDFRYDISRKLDKKDNKEIIIDEEGNEIEIETEGKIKEKVASEYPTINVKNWTDMLYDPRYKFFDEMPAVIEKADAIRMSDLKRNKDELINLDKLELLESLPAYQYDPDGYKQAVYSITGVEYQKAEGINKNALSITKYYGLYDIKDGDERLYEIWVVNDVLCIKFEEITQIPFEQIRCFEDTDTNMAYGFLESIIGLQKELNYKKNSASEYINHVINRSYIWSPQSGISPKHLVSKPNNIIPTTKSASDAMENLQELPQRSIDPSFFQEQNDFERQIQGLTFTVDTSNQRNAQALTNTATGARIKFYESNVVLDQVRKNYEEGMVRIAYKLLQTTAENIENNIIIKKIDEDGFWDINKEAILNAIDKYDIRIETGSSSMATIEGRREEALAKYQLGLQAAGAGVPVDLQALFIDVLETFEGTDGQKYIQKQNPMDMLQQGMGGGGKLPEMEQKPEAPAELTKAVAQGSVQGM